MNDFDWVTARANCSLVAIFEQLKAELQRDVETRNGMAGGGGYKLNLAPNMASVVYGDSDFAYKVVTFSLGKVSIEVKNNAGEVIISASPTLTDDGRCLLKISGKECELWHFRKKALESMFFDR